MQSTRSFGAGSRYCRGSAAAALLMLASACASTDGPRPVGHLPAVAVENLDERALLLLLADRETYEPIAVSRALDGGAELRRQAALTLGRVGDRRGAPALEALLGDSSAQVRQAAAFALGEVGEQSGEDLSEALLGAVLDADRETGRLAVEALAKLGTPLETVIERLIEVPSEELFPRLLPSLFRFDGDAVVRWAEQGLEQPEPAQRAMAAYALARNPRPEGAPLLRTLLMDDDSQIRGWAARGIGRVGERADVERLRPLAGDAAPGPIIQALRAVRRLVTDGKTPAPADWRPLLLELIKDPRPGVRLTAIEVAAVWLLDEDLSDALVGFVSSGVRRERELALLALAEGEDPRAAALLVRLAGDPDPVMRARVAEAAGFFRAAEVLEQLATDDSPGVRTAALDTRLAGDPPEAAELVLTALADGDPAVRASALAWARENPVFEMPELLAAMAVTWRDRQPDARVAGVRALLARAGAAEEERERIVESLEVLAGDAEFLVRRQAAGALADLGLEPPAVGAAHGDRSVQIYRQIVQQTHRPRRVDLVTERGSVRLELACPEAPFTCLNFLQLASQGYYDGLTFHRVVPDFVVQAGDPRGDGWGGPGYAIRDEMNLLRYSRGAVGMALSGPDTGGSQFFVTLAPQPHLDGGYTIFGRVIAGEEVLDEIVQGDRILRIVEAPGP